jgi:hypothetical protein
MVYKIYGLYDEGTLRYVGCTSQSLVYRLQQHNSVANKAKGKQCYRICWIKSMQLRGKPIIIKLLASFNTRQEMYKAEVDWIAQTRLDGADLVNTCTGGKGSNGHKWKSEDYEKHSLKVKQYSLKGELIAVHNSLSDAAELITGDRKKNTKLSLACRGSRGRRTAFGYIWRYINDAFNKYPTTGQWNVTQAQREAISKRQTENNVMTGRTGRLNHNSVAINQLSLDKEVITSFDSIAEAISITGVKTILEASIKGSIAGGFYWERVVPIKRRYSPILEKTQDCSIIISEQ